MVEFGRDGPVGTPRPVLDIGTHLSYPFVFAHEGAIYMIPESCATQGRSMSIASCFPDRWVKHATPPSGIAASDATVFEHGWWMLATARWRGRSRMLMRFARPAWPWTPHRANPVLVDIGNRAPRGSRGEARRKVDPSVPGLPRGLWCGARLAEITRLDDEAFEQSALFDVISSAGPLWRRRLHTLNRAGRLSNT